MDKEIKKMSAQELRAKILASKDARVKELEVKEWGVTIWVHSLRYGERNKLLTDSGLGEKVTGTMDVKKINSFIMNLIVLTVKDNDGNQVFTKKDIEELETRNSEIVDEIATVATELSGLGAGGRARIKSRFQKK